VIQYGQNSSRSVDGKRRGVHSFETFQEATVRNFIGIAIFLLALTVSMRAKPPQGLAAQPPSWAFPVPDKTPPTGFEDAPQKHVPGSSQTYDRPRIDPFSPPDWFPDEHSPMPPIVRQGSGKAVQACAYCHLASGSGHPQSANVAGLPVGYFLQQLADFKSGDRKDGLMNPYARALSDDDARQAAEWFASLTPRPWVKVVETDTVPQTFVFITRERYPVPGGGTEPLGNRIIEVPEDPARSLSYDSHSGFIAYVPVGSIARGEALVSTGGSGKTTACATCHGESLTGVAEVPRIAGLFPTYIFRQLYTFKNGDRTGTSAELMKGVVAHLTEDDMVDISAYVGSLKP
jgi:cytochrome c553